MDLIVQTDYNMTGSVITREYTFKDTEYLTQKRQHLVAYSDPERLKVFRQIRSQTSKDASPARIIL